jgi:hypothetical protein
MLPAAAQQIEGGLVDASLGGFLLNPALAFDLAAFREAGQNETATPGN